MLVESEVGPDLVGITSSPRLIEHMADQVVHLKDTTNTYLVMVAYRVKLVVLLDITEEAHPSTTLEEVQAKAIEASIKHIRDFKTTHQHQEP